MQLAFFQMVIKLTDWKYYNAENVLNMNFYYKNGFNTEIVLYVSDNQYFSHAFSDQSQFPKVQDIYLYIFVAVSIIELVQRSYTIKQ